MKYLTFLMAGLLLVGARAAAEDAPTYDRQNIYNTTDLTPIPHASFINVPKLTAYKSCVAQARSDAERNRCEKYEFQVPYSMADETVRVGQDMRQAWQRLEDRYYWRAMLNLNNPAMYISHCLIDFSQNRQADKPQTVINTNDSMYPKELAGKIPQQGIKDKLQMDSYSIFPNVPNSDYCDGVNFDFTLMYLPGSCVYLGTKKLFCIQGSQETLNPLAPRPIGFLYNEALNRVKAATAHAEQEYQKQYQQDILHAIKPTAKFFPMLWDTMLSGALIAPAQTLLPDSPLLTALTQKAVEAGNKLEGVFKATAPVYYAQGLTSNAVTLPLRVHVLPNKKDVLVNPNPPGVWKLEEFKRTFPQEPSAVYERFGYTNLFSAWTRPTVKLLPEPLSAKPLRQMIYMAVGNNVYLPNTTPIPMPAPILIKEYSAGLPYAGLQSHFTWQSVAEGYEVPQVSGVPPVDYPF